MKQRIENISELITTYRLKLIFIINFIIAISLRIINAPLRNTWSEAGMFNNDK